MTQKSLLIQPIPYADESAGSFLIRAAKANGFSSVYSLCYMQAYCNPKTLSSRITQQKKFCQLIAILGLDNTYSKRLCCINIQKLSSPQSIQI
ncbi:TniQ family protein [Acinetobacter colistiniresistens]|uniref:TniQ family protein n=1 Tax=Acinetobacter colistiniresistens TaxID=280145 RepID=UPI00208E9433|nr:TniQ family protein [Acinetobacter colistiniresistens]